MNLEDYLNEQEIISAMSEIMEISNGGSYFKSDRDLIIETLNEYFDTSKVAMIKVTSELLDSKGYAIYDQDKVIHILVKYFGVPKIKINMKKKE